MVSPFRGYKERRKRSSYEEVMNFRSLLIILYFYLIQNRRHYPKPCHRCNPEYAPRTRLRYRVTPIVSTLRMTHAMTISDAYALRTPVRPAYSEAPASIKGIRRQPSHLLISSRFCAEALRVNPRSYPEAPVSYSSPEASPEILKIPKSAVPESKLCPREVRFSKRSSRSAVDYYFYNP